MAEAAAPRGFSKRQRRSLLPSIGEALITLSCVGFVTFVVGKVLFPLCDIGVYSELTCLPRFIYLLYLNALFSLLIEIFVNPFSFVLQILVI